MPDKFMLGAGIAGYRLNMRNRSSEVILGYFIYPRRR